MSPEEVRELLATIANHDGRAVDARTIMDWHDALKGVPFEFAKPAVTAWYQTNRGWIQVSDVARGAVELAGLDRPDTVTRRRLEGVELPWAGDGLAPVLALPEIERKAADEG